MKNILFISLLLLTGSTFIFSPGHAQLQQAPLSNIEGNARSITSKLKTALTLTEEQQPKILTAVTNFLEQRSTILPMNNSNPKAYKTKLKSFQNGFNRKLKTILTPEQFTGFQELKPVNNDMTNVLSQLFY
jgi:Spy/CpxP family protein refolding chaperone